jgi:hypothetical protein
MSTQPSAGFPTGIGAPATRALIAAGYSGLSELDGVPVADLQRLHGMGPRALRVIQEALQKCGMSLGQWKTDR